MPKAQVSRHRRRYLAGTRREHDEAQRRGGKCEQCGYDGPWHHYNWAHIVPLRRNKEKPRNYMAMWRSYSDERFYAEVAKCRWLCLFCHADETHEQRILGWQQAPVRTFH